MSSGIFGQEGRQVALYKQFVDGENGKKYHPFESNGLNVSLTVTLDYLCNGKHVYQGSIQKTGETDKFNLCVSGKIENNQLISTNFTESISFHKNIYNDLLKTQLLDRGELVVIAADEKAIYYITGLKANGTGEAPSNIRNSQVNTGQETANLAPGFYIHGIENSKHKYLQSNGKVDEQEHLIVNSNSFMFDPCYIEKREGDQCFLCFPHVNSHKYREEKLTDFNEQYKVVANALQTQLYKNNAVLMLRDSAWYVVKDVQNKASNFYIVAEDKRRHQLLQSDGVVSDEAYILRYAPCKGFIEYRKGKYFLCVSLFDGQKECQIDYEVQLTADQCKHIKDKLLQREKEQNVVLYYSQEVSWCNITHVQHEVAVYMFHQGSNPTLSGYRSLQADGKLEKRDDLTALNSPTNTCYEATIQMGKNNDIMISAYEECENNNKRSKVKYSLSISLTNEQLLELKQATANQEGKRPMIFDEAGEQVFVITKVDDNVCNLVSAMKKTTSEKTTFWKLFSLRNGAIGGISISLIAFMVWLYRAGKLQFLGA